jgi:hypothetical protein
MSAARTTDRDIAPRGWLAGPDFARVAKTVIAVTALITD